MPFGDDAMNNLDLGAIRFDGGSIAEAVQDDVCALFGQGARDGQPDAAR